MTDWHQLDHPQILEKLNTKPNEGLSEEEARRRLEEYGPNELVDRGQKSPWKILLEQFTGIMVVILMVAAVISFFLGDLKDAIAILAIVILNAVLGFTQEYRAEQAMAALKKMAIPLVKVRREGHVRQISARELVPGDLVILEAGDSVPADGRVIESVNLRVQEAVLTGESEPVEKTVEPLEDPHLAIGDRRNMVFMGTVVTYGRGLVIAAETGMRTQLGLIADLIQGVGQEKTPLQRRLEQLGRGLAVAALVIVALVFLLGLLRGEEIRLLILTSISMAVAAVPEGLPAVVTIALALGAQRMLARRALIRKLPAVETLGSVTVICSDKTGTLTQNQMTVTVIDVPGNRIDLTEKLRDFSPSMVREEQTEPALSSLPDPIPLLLACSALCNDAILEQSENDPRGYTAVGDPTEGALVIAAARAGLWKAEMESQLPRIAELPFDSDRKRMSTAHQVTAAQLPGAFQSAWQWVRQQTGAQPTGFVITKGAVDSLLEISDRVWCDGDVVSLDTHWTERIEQANNQLAQNGMRVLGVAFRPLDSDEQPPKPDSLERNLVFLGLIGMIDPARPEVRDAVQTCRAAGISPMMITGDHPLTALYIGRELGIARSDQVLTGQDLQKMSVEELENVVETVAVYARVSPEHKLKIVQALQDRGHVVAMTGDGVNDAPALKKADIGVAMGITGTDVTKEASDMILLDDNFATIVSAVEEGRRIYDNIRKFIRYTMTSNAGEIWVMLLAPFLGMPFPLLPLQILWVNLVTDGLPGLALTVEPGERDIMRRPPISPKENVFGRGMAVDILWVGLLMGLVSLGMGFWAWSTGHEAWQTMVFTTLTLSQMGNAFAVRSERDSLFKIGLFSNKSMLGAVLLTFALQMALIYVPFLQPIFNTRALSLSDLVISLLFSTVVFFGIEIRKRFFPVRRR